MTTQHSLAARPSLPPLSSRRMRRALSGHGTYSQRQYGGGLLQEGCCCRRCLHNVIGISSAFGKTPVTPEACRCDLDKMTRLADYFVVVGYDLDKRGKRETQQAILPPPPLPLTPPPPDLLDWSVLVAVYSR